MGGHRAGARSVARAAAAVGAAPGWAARRDRAVVLHERLDLPDRARGRPRAGRSEPIRARLPLLGPFSRRRYAALTEACEEVGNETLAVVIMP